MIYTKKDLYEKAVDLLRRIPYYNPSKFKIHLEYVTYDMTPSIDICESGYHLDMYERGQLVSRETTTDVSRVLYWIIEYSISQYAHRVIRGKYTNNITKSLTYTERIRQEERDIKLNSFKFIGDVYLDWYCKSNQFNRP